MRWLRDKENNFRANIEEMGLNGKTCRGMYICQTSLRAAYAQNYTWTDMLVMNNWLIEDQELTTMRLRDVLRTSWLTQKPTIILSPSILCACPTVCSQSNGCPEGGTLLVLSPSFCSTVSMGSRPSSSNLSAKECHRLVHHTHCPQVM
jgi:hypothetical protein